MKTIALLTAGGLAMMSAGAADQINNVKFLFQFASPVEATAWQIVNDDVMGGISRSTFTVASNGPALFRGELSLANNGGFASVRSQPEVKNLSRWDGFLIRVRGDGRTYKFTARTDGSFDSVLYQLSFTTKAGAWTEHRFAFTELVPTFRGRVLSEAPKFDPARTTSVGFMLADKQAGAFALEIDWIKADSTARN